MAVAFRSSSNTGNDQSVSTLSPAVPSGAAIDDVVVAVLTRWTSTTAITASGFTDWGTTYNSGDGQANLHILWKRLTAADTGTYTFSWTTAAWSHVHLFCFSGCITAGNPIEAVNNWSGTADTFGSTSVSTSTIPGLVWSCYNDSSGTHTPPTGFTEVIDFDSGAAAYLIGSSPGTQTASGASVTSSSPAAALLIALKADGAAIIGSKPRSFHPGRGPNRFARFYTTPRATDTTAAAPTVLADTISGTLLGGTTDTLAIGVALTDTVGGIRTAGTADALAIGITVTDLNNSGIRAGDTFGESAVSGIVVADPAAGGIRTGSTADTIAVGVALADSASAIRVETTGDTIAVGLTLTDTPRGITGGTGGETLAVGRVLADPISEGVRAGDTAGETATTALVITDPSAGGIRAASTTGTLILDIVLTDTAAGSRAGTTASTAAVGVTLTDTAGGVRQGNTFGETATAALVMLDPSTGQIRAGAGGAETIVQGTGLFDPTAGGIRVGATTGTLAAGLLLTDTANGIRGGGAAETVAATVVLQDLCGGVRAAAGGLESLVVVGPVVPGTMTAHIRPGPTMTDAGRVPPTMTATPRSGPTMTEVTGT